MTCASRTYHIDEQIDNFFQVLICSEKHVDYYSSNTVEHGQNAPCHKQLARNDVLIETFGSIDVCFTPNSCGGIVCEKGVLGLNF